MKDRIRREKPVIVILGFGIAGAAGSRLLREIKFDPDIRHVTVFLVSHPDDKEAYADAITVGAREVIPGPVNMGEFQFRVNRAYEAIDARRRRATAVKTRTGKADAKAWGESKSKPKPEAETPTAAPRTRPAPAPATRGRRAPARPSARPGRRPAAARPPAPRGRRVAPARRRKIA